MFFILISGVFGDVIWLILFVWVIVIYRVGKDFFCVLFDNELEESFNIDRNWLIVLKKIGEFDKVDMWYNINFYLVVVSFYEKKYF